MPPLYTVEPVRNLFGGGAFGNVWILHKIGDFIS